MPKLIGFSLSPRTPSIFAHWSLLSVLICLSLTKLSWGQTTNLPAAAKLDQLTTQFGNQFAWQLRLDEPSTKPSLNKTIDVARRDLEPGLSQIVGTPDAIYIATGAKVASENQQDAGNDIASTLSRYRVDSATGEVESTPDWTHQTTGTFRGNQQTFGAAGPAAQATPLLVDDYLVHVSFTGTLVCLNATSGALLWQKDLVTEFAAEPVQFGFSSSPVVNPQNRQQFLIFAPGDKGGLLNLDLKTGKVVWRAACQTFSYATPVAARLGGIDQWILVTQNRVLGVNQQAGQLLWEYALPETGLTNVPSPVVVDEQRIIISGQGVKGTRCLKIERLAGDRDDATGLRKRWAVSEVWYQPKVQFFYTNWLMLDDRLLAGCTERYLAIIDTQNGKVAGKFRGFGNGNLARLSTDQLLIMDGQANLHRMELVRSNNQVTGLMHQHSFQLNGANKRVRCWTPLTAIGNRLYSRGEKQLFSIDLLSASNRSKTGQSGAVPQASPRSQSPRELELVSSQLTQPKPLMFRLTSTGDSASTTETPNPVERIFATFQDEGQAAAWKLYLQLRQAKQLSVKDRLQLIQGARQQNLNALAKQIQQHAQLDFPKESAFQSNDQSTNDQ